MPEAVGTRDFDRSPNVVSDVFVNVVDQMPPPRHLHRSFYSHHFPAMSAILDTIALRQATRAGIDFVHVMPEEKDPDRFLKDMIVEGLREEGYRIGLFRKRKIGKVIELELAHD